MKFPIVRVASILCSASLLAAIAYPHTADAAQVTLQGSFVSNAPNLVNLPGSPPTISSVNGSGVIPKFNTALGNLTGINIGLQSSFSYSISGNATNFNATAQMSGTGAADLLFGFDVGGPLITIGTRNQSTSISCVGGGLNASCSDSTFVQESFVTNAQLDPAFWGSFLDTSFSATNYRADRTVTASLDDCRANCSLTLAGFSWAGTVTITYDYEAATTAPIPEPAVPLILSIGLAGILARRANLRVRRRQD